MAKSKLRILIHMDALKIHSQITCPHCWFEIHPADFLWVSSSTELRGDPYLGSEALKRFLPSRFDYQGFAIDEKGSRCESVACPKCHLVVPRILCENWPLFLSILGAPASGKSYFLAAAIWEARQRLCEFDVNFMDADPVANKVISDYEKKLFLSDDQEQLVTIMKTETDGNLYQEVNFGSRTELFARPFVFSMRPDEENPYGQSPNQVAMHSRALCVYDNAGEHFLPDAEAELSPATSHLALSKALLFVFDPIQHPKFRRETREFSDDPQLGKDFATYRQDEILQEAAKRIRRKANLAETDKFEKPLVVVVNKYDVWRHLCPKLNLEKINPFVKVNGRAAINVSLIQKVSDHVEQILKKLAPEIVSTCKAFCKDITYIPVSPIGNSPERNMRFGANFLGVRPRNVSPIWAEVPLLYAMARSDCRLVPMVESTSKKSSAIAEGRIEPRKTYRKASQEPGQ